MMDDKELQFDRLWEGITPKGVNRTKALKFRQYILEHVRQMRRPLNRDNAKKYWLGQLQAEIKDRENFCCTWGPLPFRWPEQMRRKEQHVHQNTIRFTATL